MSIQFSRKQFMDWIAYFTVEQLMAVLTQTNGLGVLTGIISGGLINTTGVGGGGIDCPCN